MANPFDQFDTFATPAAPARRSGGIDVNAIARGAQELGIDPVDLATAISYETGGTFDPDQWGPTTKWGRHRGLIQFGEPQRAQYGVRPGMTVAEQMPAVVAYLRDAGVRPGMGMLDVYSAINAGGVGRYNASDAAAGGAPGTVADKVNQQMGDHRRRAQQLLGGIGGGGGGGSGGAMPANPFDQFDNLPAAPDFGNVQTSARSTEAPSFAGVQTAINSTEGLRGLPALPGEVLQSGNGDIPARPEDREVGRIYTDKRGQPRRWMGNSWAAGDSARETTLAELAGGAGIDVVQGMTRAPESLLDLIGWVSGGESLLTPEGKQAFEDSRQWLETFKPEAYRAEQAAPVVQRDAAGGVAGLNMPSGESIVGTIAQSIPQIPQMVATGGGLRTAVQGVLPNAPRLASVLGYGGANAGMVAPGIAEQARTEALQAGATPEQAQDAANKAMAMAVPLTMATGGLGEGLAGVQGSGARSLLGAMIRGAATEAPAESVEEAGTSAIGDIAQGRDVNAANALESGIMAAFGGGLPGAAVAGAEYTGNRNRPAALPEQPATMADIVAQAQALAPIVSAEAAGAGAVPRQGEAPAAPPPVPTAQLQEAPVPATPEARPDLAAATRAIDNRLAALDETAAGRLDEAEVSQLAAERQELDDLLREQDRARREGIVQPLEARLSPEERATADARRQEIAATLERHRAARTAADQAQRLRSRLEGADTDAALYEVAREINPTLGTPQAESFRAPAVKEESPQIPAPSPPQAEAQPVQTDIGTGQNAQNVADIPSRPPANVVEQQQAPTTSAQPAAPRRAPTATEAQAPALEVAPAASEGPRPEAQRQPMPESGDLTNSANPPRTTGIKNAVTDAERIAEGRDPIIREARKGNRETVDEAMTALRETPTLGRETAARVAAGGPVELKDEAVLLVHKVDLRKRRDAAAERAQSPTLDEEARTAARREYEDLVQQIDEVDQAAVRIGTESGRLLQLRRRMIAEDYSLPALERKLRMVVNRDLKPAERAELAEMAEKVATLQRKLDAVESQQASAQVAEMLARLMKQAPGRNATLAERRAAAAESRAALSAMAAGRTPQRSIPDTPYDAALKIRRARAREMRAEGGSLADYADSEHAYWLRGGKLRANGRLTLYRAVRPGGSIQPGDYVTNSRAYAAQHLRDNLGGDGEILSVEGWSDEIFPADGPGEFWYAPRSLDAPESVSQRSLQADRGEPGQARAALADRFGRGVIRALERDGVLKFEGPAGGSWDGATIRIGDVRPENAVGVLLHEASHARLAEVLGPKAYDTALRDLDALEAAGDAVALKAARRAARSGETGARLDDERLAYLVEEAAKANRTTGGVSGKVRELARRLLSAFRQWAATSSLYRALERVGAPRPTLQPEDFVGFAEASLRQLQRDAAQPEARRLRGKIGQLETELRTDRLTGMRNRRAFDEDEALGWPTVAAIDMDGLGKLNEAVGHEAANKVLKALADTFMAAEADGVRVYRHTGGDELAVRFKDSGDADRVMADLQQQLEGMNIEMDVAGDDGRVRSFTYEGIGISYGIGDTYEAADARAGRQKIEREAAGVRQAKTDTRPSRRLREDSPRPGGRRAGDPPAVAAQRSIPKGEPDAGAPVPAGADPVAFFHLARMGAFHYADGARDVAEWTRRMEADLGAAAGQYRGMLPDAFKAAQAQATRPTRGQESVAEAVEAIGDQRRPRDVKRVVRAVVAEGMRGEDQVFEAAAQALDMETDAVRALFVQPEPGPRTLSEAQAEIERLRKALRAAQRPDQETRYQDQRARDFQRRIAELEERIAAGDFAKRERVERNLTKENERLRFELEKAKTRFHQYAIAAEFAQRTPLGKLWGETVAGINFSRAIMTALDLSAVFRQGGFIVFGHPVRGAKALPDMFSAMLSEQSDFEQRQNIQRRTNAALYQRAGLQFTGIGGDALTRVEETFASRWVEKMASFADIRIDWQNGKVFRAGAKVPFAILGGGVRGSGRAYTAFLNRLRADSFDAMLNSLARNPENPTKEEIRAIAKYINVATGRGDFFGRHPGEAMTAAFFAPRLVLSRFQLLAAPATGFKSFGGSARTQRLIAQEYARFLIGVSVFITLAAMMRDEDDETKFIELDPRSSAFGKVRIGDTFLDPLGGLAQVTVFTSRILTGETRKDVSAADAAYMASQGVPRSERDGGLQALRAKGRLSDYVEAAGDGYDLPAPRYGAREAGKVIWDFTRSKFSPVVGWGFNIATGTDFKGDPITPLEATGQLVVPMSVGSVIDVMEAHGMARGTAINLFNILGAASQYRKSDAEEAAEEQNGIWGSLGVGTAEDLQ